MSKRPFIGVSTSVLCTMIVASIPGAREEGLARQASRQAKGKAPNKRLDAVLAPCTSIPAPAPAPVEDEDADTLAACVDDTMESDNVGLAYHIDRLVGEGKTWGEVYHTLCGRGKPFTYRQIAEYRGLSANGCQVAASRWRTANKATA
jgi:hypothetical protein